MEENYNSSDSPIYIPESRIRVFESKIQAELENFEKEVSDTTFLETSNVCESVKDQILYYEDEPQLSKTQNNCRRIFIASDLFISICSIYGHIVDNEFTKIINDMVQWEKYKKLSRKIMHKMHLERKREKYFAKEAETKLLKALEDTKRRTTEEKEPEIEVEGRESAQKPLEDLESVPEHREGLEEVTTPVEVTEEVLTHLEGRETERGAAGEMGSPPIGINPAETEAAEAIPDYETLAPPLESTFRSSMSRNLTEIRAEPVTDISHLQDIISTTSRHDLSLMGTVAETSIREPTEHDRSDDDLNQILQILEDQISQKVGDVPQPIEPLELREPMEPPELRETMEPLELREPLEPSELREPIEPLELRDPLEPSELREPTEPREAVDAVQEAPTVEELETVSEKPPEKPEEGSEEWSLPSLEPVEKTRKRNRLIIDDVTIIPQYAARAVQLNRNINIERVQVFEGPPNILQGISVNHLMGTPGWKSSIFKDVRSSKLSMLFSRHLKLERKPVEPVLPFRVEEKKRDDTSKARVTIETIEEVEERAKMRSVFEKSDLLTELPPDKTRHEELEIPMAPPQESLIGMPVSRIISSVIQPPEEVQMQRINAAPILPTPRVQQLQGKTLDPKPTSSWFFSSKQNPPSGKYREFNYIYKKLVQYWSLLEIQGMEKCMTLREFFEFEEDASLANYLTAMRIVDKLSIQRKLLLEFKNNEVFIKPFESPYASGGQLLLKGKEPLL